MEVEFECVTLILTSFGRLVRWVRYHRIEGVCYDVRTSRRNELARNE